MPRLSGVAGHAAQTPHSLLLPGRKAHLTMSEVLPLLLAGEIVATARRFPRRSSCSGIDVVLDIELASFT
jgi:hypothetical protein